MYKTETIEEILENLDKTDYSKYKLCYIDNISDTITDWDPESKRYMSQPGFSWEIEHKKYGIGNNPHLRTCEYSNPHYISEKQEFMAWFTDIDNLLDQSGDDWDDAPYEHNAGRPYDKLDRDKECNILQVPFYVPYPCKFPSDYGRGNSPFSVYEINSGAIPWIFGRTKEWILKIDAGISLELFILKINDIQAWNK